MQFESSKNNIVIFRKGSIDTFCAAWLFFRAWAQSAQYIEVNDEDPLPDPSGKRLYILGVHYHPNHLHRLNEVADGLVWFDNRQKSNDFSKSLKDMADFVERDPHKSTSMTVWEFMMRTGIGRQAFEDCPELVRYVQDGELGQFRLPHALQAFASICAMPRIFDIWNARANDTGIGEHSRKGEAILDAQMRSVEEHMAVAVDMETDDSVHGMVVNCSEPLVAERVSRELAQLEGALFGGCWHIKGKHLHWLLQSKLDGGANMGRVAENLGGTGTPHKASFSIDLERPPTDKGGLAFLRPWMPQSRIHTDMGQGASAAEPEPVTEAAPVEGGSENESGADQDNS